MSNQGKFAEGGWLIEVKLTIDEGPAFRFFAVGTTCPREAEEALLRFPGVFRDDARKVRRQLSGAEIARLELRAHAVRPYRAERRASDVSRETRALTESVLVELTENVEIVRRSTSIVIPAA